MSETKVTTNNEPGIIGQMYEDRKSHKIGVLESRNSKYKTLMMRAEDGSSFNITFATFRSNWRKYNGETVVQTSTQVEEQATEEKKREENDKQIVESKSENVKITTEQKVKIVRALSNLISDRITNDKIKVFRTSKGAITVCYRRYKLFEVWVKFNTDMYDFVVRDDVFEFGKDKLVKLAEQTKSETVYKEKWEMKNMFSVKSNNGNSDKFIDTLIEISSNYVDSNINADKKEGE